MAIIQFRYDLSRAVFQSKDISLRITVTRAVCAGHSLNHAYLRGADLKDIVFCGANLRNADLQNANMGGANLKDANLQNADLNGANLKYAVLCRADLEDADLQNADLGGADLKDTALFLTNLNGADLQNADLSGAALWDTSLAGADLSGAIMPDGQIWEDYIRDPLAGICDEPAARTRAIAAWGKNGWGECPMSAAHGWRRAKKNPHRGHRVRRAVRVGAAAPASKVVHPIRCASSRAPLNRKVPRCHETPSPRSRCRVPR
jgi:Pentapeptide repeats (8 copies)